MRIRDIMSTDVQTAAPSDTIQAVAQRMASGDFGFVPVVDGGRLVGTITDRDLAIRAIAAGAGPDTPVSDVMTHDVVACSDDEDPKAVLDLMGSKQIRRLPILKDGQLAGVVSLGDLSTKVKEKYAGEALEDISRSPAGR